MTLGSKLKDHPLYDQFQIFRENRDWDQFKIKVLLERFSDMTADIERFNDVTSEIKTNLKGFSNFRLLGNNSSFKPEVGRETLKTGFFGSLWTAKVMVSREYENGLVFSSDLGREIIVSEDFWDIGKLNWKDSIVRNYNWKTGDLNGR